MRVHVFAMVMMSALMVGGVGHAVAYPAAAAQEVAVKQNDRSLDEAVEHQMRADRSLRKRDISVSVADGVVTLSGTVQTNAERRRAGRLAKVSGVTRVENQLVVGRSETGTKGTLATAGEKAKEGAQKTKDVTVKGAKKTKEVAKEIGEKTKEGAEKVGEKTKEGLSKTGEVITDAWITGRVKARFIGEDLLKGSNINVDTDDRVVTLKGTVPSEAGRLRAVEIARSNEGVRQVVDRLVVAPKP